MSKVHQRGPAKPEMNITPLIDVVFLLIVFFMLVNKIVAEENVEMVVPDLADPKTFELGEVDRVVVNVAPMPGVRDRNNPLMWDGEPAYVTVSLTRFNVGDLDGITNALQAAKANNPEVEVLLRADSALYYEAVQPIMGAITGAGISKVNLVAFLPDEGPTPGDLGEN